MHFYPIKSSVALVCLMFFISTLAMADILSEQSEEEGCCCGTGKKHLLIGFGGGMTGSSGKKSMLGDAVEKVFGENPDESKCVEYLPIDYGLSAEDYFWGTRTTLGQEMIKAAEKKIDNATKGKEYCSITTVGYSGGGYLASWLGTLHPDWRTVTINGAVTPVAEVADEAGSTHVQQVALEEGFVDSEFMKIFFDPKPMFPLPPPPGAQPDGAPFTHYIAENDGIIPPVCQEAHNPNSLVKKHKGGHTDNLEEGLKDIITDLPCEGCGDKILDVSKGEECDPPNGVRGWSYGPGFDEITFFQCSNSCKLVQNTRPAALLGLPDFDALVRAGYIKRLEELPWYHQSKLASSPSISVLPMSIMPGKQEQLHFHSVTPIGY